jgi:hypothetical protein
MTIPQQQSQQQLQANRQPPAQLDMQAAALGQAYFDIRDKNLSPKGPWSLALQDLASHCNGMVNRAGGFDYIAPPAWVEHRPAVQWQPGGVRGRTGDSTWTRETIQATPYMTQALTVAQGMRDDLVRDHSNDYKAIIDQALAQCAPEALGPLTPQAKVDDLKRELLAVLSTLPSGPQARTLTLGPIPGSEARNQAALRILKQAVADNNVTLIYVLLSGPMDNMWLAFGDVDVKGLQRIYAQATAKANAPLGRPNPPAVELVALQDGPYALSGLVDACVAYFDYEMRQTRSYLSR